MPVGDVFSTGPLAGVTCTAAGALRLQAHDSSVVDNYVRPLVPRLPSTKGPVLVSSQFLSKESGASGPAGCVTP